MDRWCFLNIEVAESLDSCAYGAVRIIGIKVRPGAVIMERLHGAGGTRKQFEPGADRAFQVGK